MDAQSRRRWRQFSLLNLALLVALCGALFGLAALRRENDALREQVRVREGELNALNVYDSSMIWARSVRHSGEQWRWRVYFPAERRYRVHVATRTFDGKGQDLFAETTFPSGELTITAEKLAENSEGSVIQVRFPDETLRFYLDNWSAWPGKHDGLGEASTSFETNATITLLKFIPKYSLQEQLTPEKMKALFIDLEPVSAEKGISGGP